MRTRLQMTLSVTWKSGKEADYLNSTVTNTTWHEGVQNHNGGIQPSGHSNSYFPSDIRSRNNIWNRLTIFVHSNSHLTNRDCGGSVFIVVPQKISAVLKWWTIGETGRSSDHSLFVYQKRLKWNCNPHFRNSRFLTIWGTLPMKALVSCVETVDFVKMCHLRQFTDFFQLDFSLWWL